MRTKLIGYYSIFLFAAISAYWILTLRSGSWPEGGIEMTFHVISELIMAIICLLGGILLLRRNKYGPLLNTIGLSMILYSVLNAAGYFGQTKEWGSTAMFVCLFVITSAVLYIQAMRYISEDLN